MDDECTDDLDPHIQDALTELRGVILKRYPMAMFQVSSDPEEPESVLLVTTVDVDDLTEVLDLVIDRVVELQVEEGIPVHVIPERPIERTIAQLRAEGDLPHRVDC